MSLYMLILMMCYFIAPLEAMLGGESSINEILLHDVVINEPDSLLPQDAKLLIPLLNAKAEMLVENADFLHDCYHLYCFNNFKATCGHCGEHEIFIRLLQRLKCECNLQIIHHIAHAAVSNVRMLLQRQLNEGTKYSIKMMEQEALEQAIKDVQVRSRY